MVKMIYLPVPCNVASSDIIHNWIETVSNGFFFNLFHWPHKGLNCYFFTAVKMLIGSCNDKFHFLILELP